MKSQHLFERLFPYTMWTGQTWILNSIRQSNQWMNMKTPLFTYFKVAFTFWLRLRRSELFHCCLCWLRRSFTEAAAMVAWVVFGGQDWREFSQGSNLNFLLSCWKLICTLIHKLQWLDWSHYRKAKSLRNIWSQYRKFEWQHVHADRF